MSHFYLTVHRCLGWNESSGVSANLPKSCFSRPCVRACVPMPTCYVTIFDRERERSKEELCTGKRTLIVSQAVGVMNEEDT